MENTINPRERRRLQKREADKAYRAKHREEIKARNRTLARRWRQTKYAAKRRGIEFDLSYEFYCQQVAQPCFYCDNVVGVPCQTNAGLDRLDNARGYLEDNVVSCCRVCNELKLDQFSPEETIVMIEALIEYREKLKGVGQ